PSGYRRRPGPRTRPQDQETASLGTGQPRSTRRLAIVVCILVVCILVVCILLRVVALARGAHPTRVLVGPGIGSVGAPLRAHDAHLNADAWMSIPRLRTSRPCRRRG